MKQRYLIFPFLFISILIAVFTISGCKKQEYIKTGKVKPEKRIAEFQVNSIYPRIIKLYKDTVYILDVDFERNAGEELIIEEGTLIKAGSRPLANLGNVNPAQGSVTINTGGVIIANGSLSEPIIFTSNGLKGSQGINWGGITLQGKSTNNDNAAAGDASDFSGSLIYCRIEFAPLTLRGVGNTSTFSHVSVSYTDRNGLSAFNIYGGTFNASNLISYACAGPADFYITNGYTGKMQNILAYRNPFFGSTGSAPLNALTGIFFENNLYNPVNARPFTFPTISNLSIIGPDSQNGATATYSSFDTRASAIVTTGSSCFNIRNSVFMGFPKACWILDDANTAGAIQNRVITISNSIFQANDTTRVFYLEPNAYPPYTSIDFKNFILAPTLHNREASKIADFSFKNLFNYNEPGLLPAETSPVFSGADFKDIFSDPFFNPVGNVGAFGKEDWTKGWMNFTPLKTNYNFPE